ncbi:MAG TPA: hypothetical protein VK102_05580 [Sphingobacterium sp.]|nr:hypothetical protein [Sphingobacterium sp.]
MSRGKCGVSLCCVGLAGEMERQDLDTLLFMVLALRRYKASDFADIVGYIQKSVTQ